MQNYDSADTARTFRDPPRLAGVYKSALDPRSGIASEQSIDAWAQRARVNSYHGGHGEGKDPTMPDRRNSVPDGSPGKDSDGYLASTKNWPSFGYGSESGLGRIEKTHSRK